jgi:hypothetical protein
MFHPAYLLYVIITLVHANPTELQETITHKKNCVKNNDLFTVPAEQKCSMYGCNRLARKETYYYECLSCQRTSDILTKLWMCILHQPSGCSEPAITYTEESTGDWKGI